MSTPIRPPDPAHDNDPVDTDPDTLGGMVVLGYVLAALFGAAGALFLVMMLRLLGCSA